MTILAEILGQFKFLNLCGVTQDKENLGLINISRLNIKYIYMIIAKQIFSNESILISQIDVGKCPLEKLQQSLIFRQEKGLMRPNSATIPWIS